MSDRHDVRRGVHYHWAGDGWIGWRTGHFVPPGAGAADDGHWRLDGWTISWAGEVYMVFTYVFPHTESPIGACRGWICSVFVQVRGVRQEQALVFPGEGFDSFSRNMRR